MAGMSGGEITWSVRLAATAESDFEAIIGWTREQFGDVQARAYAETLTLAMGALIEGPELPGVRARSDIGKQLFALHVARKGRKGRHFVLFRADTHPNRRLIDVLRILHDSMDIQRHVPDEEA
jgi:toxin ParE1/3/4